MGLLLAAVWMLKNYLVANQLEQGFGLVSCKFGLLLDD